MKKISRKILSILMVLTIVFGLSVTAFAADDRLVYTCLGDSNAAGYNLPGYIDNRIAVPEAYHSKVAEALGAELRPFATGGYRTDEILYMIDPTFKMDWAYADICHGKVHQNELDEYKADYIKAVVDADIITIQIGSNEIFGEDLGFAMFNAFYTSDDTFSSLKIFAEGIGGKAGEVLVKAVSAVDIAAKVVKFLADFAIRVTKTYSDFEKNWDAVIENIYRLNPDVKIVALGLVNSMGKTSIFPGSKIKTAAITGLLNLKFNYWIEKGSKYADTYDYCYVSDISGGELAFLQEDFEEKYLGDIHPTAEDHTEITRRIVEILKNDGFEVK